MSGMLFFIFIFFHSVVLFCGVDKEEKRGVVFIF
jgi:hypothetical protein